MRWRIARLDWSYGLGELVIVVVGVLIALAVDQWNTERSNRGEEKAILDRLIVDLRYDASALTRQLGGIEEKEASLLRVESLFQQGPQSVEDPSSFLRDIVIGANYGWNQYDARRITLNELLATGKLALIESSNLRELIAEYYELDSGVHNRIDERETDYPDISYQVVGRANEGTVSGDANLVELSIPGGDADRVVSQVLSSSLADHVQAELNFTRFVRAMSIRMEEAVRELINEIEAYRARLG